MASTARGAAAVLAVPRPRPAPADRPETRRAPRDRRAQSPAAFASASSRQAWMRTSTEAPTRIYRKMYGQVGAKPGPWFHGNTTSLSQLLRPVDGVDVNSERILPQMIGVVRGLNHDGQNRGPSLGCGERAILVCALDPGDAKRNRRGADDAGDLDRDLHLAEICEGIVGAGEIVEGYGTAIGGEVVGAQPLLAQHDRIDRQSPDILDEAREVIGDLRFGRLIV